jgi:hypothetical protein
VTLLAVVIVINAVHDPSKKVHAYTVDGGGCVTTCNEGESSSVQGNIQEIVDLYRIFDGSYYAIGTVKTLNGSAVNHTASVFLLDSSSDSALGTGSEYVNQSSAGIASYPIQVTPGPITGEIYVDGIGYAAVDAYAY